MANYGVNWSNWRVAKGQGMMVSEISATRHDIFTKFAMFAIRMIIWPNKQIWATHMTVTMATMISLATWYSFTTKDSGASLLFKMVIFGHNSLVYLVQCYSILWAMCKQTLVYLVQFYSILWAMCTQTLVY